jgi:Nucleotidyltransferase of unknown function (DUF6036)
MTIERFDRYLADRDLRLDAVVLGGAALSLLGVITRATEDCDVMHPMIPPAVAAAAQAFASERSAAGDPLASDWFNNGPASLARVLPPGWEDRVQPLFAGAALVLRCLGRVDLLRSKLFALCDRALDLADCIAMAPTAGELAEVVGWLEVQDANPEWPAHVRATLEDLARRLGHGLST